MRLTFLGLGLIAGSAARALRRADPSTVPGGSLEIVAWSPGGRGPAAALEAGVIDAAASSIEDALRGADLVVLAGPPPACLDLLVEIAGPLRSAMQPEATLTDVASTKALLVATADRVGLPFVGGHPMAGRETSGYAAADPELFVGRPWVVVPGAAARTRDIERVEWLARRTGAEPVRMSAEQHDSAVAAISHVPLVLAVALVEAVVGQGSGDRPDWPAARRLAASGWRDMTRLARGDVEMGAGIAVTNAHAIAARLRDVRSILDEWIVELDGAAAGGDDALAALAARFRDARARLERP